MTKGSTALSFKYNDQGLRTQKTVNGTTTKYYYEGDDVVCETNGTDTIHYTYDNNGMPLSMKLNGISYCYVYNVEGLTLPDKETNIF